jgi:nitrous oxidase accessory protein
MEARAPQYGQRVLLVAVNPRGVSGDVFELDALGHYVGIKPLGGLAHFERGAAPLGMALALVGLLAAPFVRRKTWRALLLAPVIVLPLIFLADLNYWMKVGTNHRDPDAALNLTVKDIDTKVVGRYQVGQFSVDAILSAGLFGAGTAGLISIGLIFVTPLRRRRRGASPALGVGLGTALALCLSPGGASATERSVGPGESIATAIDRAVEGDTVRVSGVHHEHLIVRKRIRLEGGGGAVLDGDGEGTLVRIQAAGVELKGLVLRGGGSSYTSEDSAIRIERATDVRLEDLVIEDTLFGIFAVEADRCRVERSSITGQDVPDTRRGDGIRLWHSSDCRIADNHVARSRDLVIWYSSGTVVENNVVRTSRYGLHFMYSDHNVFRRNRFEDDQVGAAVMYSRDIRLEENAFSFSNGPAAYGLLVKDADDVFVTGNRFLGNATALFFDGAPQSKGGRAEVRGNLIARNDVGIALEPLCRGIQIWENAFIGNRTQVEMMGTGSGDANRWAVDGRGNFWSDAVVYDPDGDGISNLPYRVESTYEVLADRFPVLAFFDGTPGAEAIDLGARLFPLFAPRPKLTDPSPLVRPMLTPWTESREDAPGGPGLLLAGASLLSLVALGATLSR